MTRVTFDLDVTTLARIEAIATERQISVRDLLRRHAEVDAFQSGLHFKGPLIDQPDVIMVTTDMGGNDRIAKGTVTRLHGYTVTRLHGRKLRFALWFR